MKKTNQILKFSIMGIMALVLLAQCNTGQMESGIEDTWANNPDHCEPPSWIPDTLCSGRPSITSWNRTDEYRLRTGRMFFEWQHDENGDSCLFAIVVQLPEGTIDNLIKAAQ